VQEEPFTGYSLKEAYRLLIQVYIIFID